MGVGSFSASSSSSSSSATSASVSATDLGVQAPTGYWDPLGLNANADAATFNRRRAVEIKHGRVAMYATMGYIVPEYYKFPGGVLSLHTFAVLLQAGSRLAQSKVEPVLTGFLSPSLGLKFTDVPNGLAAISKVPARALLESVRVGA